MEGLDLMFVGHATMYTNRDADSPTFEGDVVVEMVDDQNGIVEIAFDSGNKRTYISFRRDDLLRVLRNGLAMEQEVADVFPLDKLRIVKGGKET